MTQMILLGSDFAIFLSSFFLSLGLFPIEIKKAALIFLPVLVIKIALFVRFRLYKAILEFAGFPLASAIIKASTIASLLIFFIAHLPIEQPISNGFFVIDFFITTSLAGLIRFAPRYFSERWKKEWGTKRILIYGAGELGDQVARKLLRSPGQYRLIGFLDDSLDKINKRLHNLPVFGPLSEMGSIFAHHRISELIIAISSMSGEAVREITREGRRHGVLCRIVPSFTDMLMKDVDIKNIDISDLLKREPKDLDEPQIKRFIKGKTVMITGAGGSIGSELARQCIRYGAQKLVLIDHSEFNLYSLQEELTGKAQIRFCLMNILGNHYFEKILQEERPAILFHAAAYKHVPIVEENPAEGVINNILGTIRTSELAETYGVEKFVLISTDKAVRPTSVMGASKRIAELFTQNFNIKSKTEFVAVRFGNVLGSSGSVIPKFIEQINKGGPVTVTHPEVTRYFMLISEAVQLVLQAASIGNGGEIFILNMGKPVRITEMAEDLIYLSGREPHKDIQIEFTGLRPGEKLYEELLLNDTEKKTQYENITIARTSYVPWEKLMKQTDDLLKYAEQKNRKQILETIKQIVPEFIHSELEVSPTEKVIPLYPTGTESSYK